MKVINFFIVILMITTIGCRKDELRDDVELSTNKRDAPATCFNETMDGDEIGTDCGGSCNECDKYFNSCLSTDQAITYYFDGGAATTSMFTNVDFTTSNSDGNFYVEATTAEGEIITITFSGMPNIMQAYSLTASSNPSGPYYAYVTGKFPNHRSTLVAPPNGPNPTKVYITYEDGRYIIELCGMDFRYDAGSWIVTYKYYDTYARINCE